MVVIEFSLSQRSFNRTTVSEMIKNNFNNSIERKQTDYLPIGIFDTDKEADNFIETIGEAFKNYSMFNSCTTGQIIVIQ